MKRSDFKKHSAVFYIGKGIIVASLVATASIGFILGFFVGKYAQRSHPTPAALSSVTTTEQPSAIVTEQASTAENIATQVQQPVPSNPDQMARSEADSKHEELHDTNNVNIPKIKDKNVIPSPPKAPAQGASQKATPQRAKANVGSRETTDTPKEPSTRKYTVQVGAFKNAEEAEALKTKLNSKGYRAFVIESKTMNHGLLHKVMVGTYTTRKEAEVVSIKLRNSEGLRAFVTFAALEGSPRQR